MEQSRLWPEQNRGHQDDVVIDDDVDNDDDDDDNVFLLQSLRRDMDPDSLSGKTSMCKIS